MLFTFADIIEKIKEDEDRTGEECEELITAVLHGCDPKVILKWFDIGSQPLSYNLREDGNKYRELLALTISLMSNFGISTQYAILQQSSCQWQDFQANPDEDEGDRTRLKQLVQDDPKPEDIDIIDMDFFSCQGMTKDD